MVFKQIPLEEIDFADESFRISEQLDSAMVLGSLRAVGQLNPVCLLDGNPRKIIVCGFRRLRALRQLGNAPALARILPEDTGDPARAFHMALWDNLAHRQLDPLEKARALFKLKNLCRVPQDTLLKLHLPLLGLTPHESVLRAYLSLNGIHPDLRQCLIEGRLTHTSVEHLAELPRQTQADIAALMSKIRLSSSSQRKTLVLLEELAAIADAPLTESLKNPEVLAVLDDSRLSPFQKGERVYEALYRLRNPRLARAVERFLERKKLLGLPGSIQITADPFFETPELKVEFNASDAGRFRNLAAALQQASQTPALEGLFDVR